MWGAAITASTNVLRIEPDSGAPDVDVTLTVAPTTVPDWLPTGDGGAYDLLQNLEDALNTADVSNNYVVTLTAAWHITIAADSNFEIHWDDAATTIDPEILGWFADSADSAGANSYTSPAQSSLVWYPQQAVAQAQFPPVPHTMTLSHRTITGKRITRQIAYVAPSGHTRTFAEMLSSSSTHRGECSLRIEALDSQYVYESPTLNDSLDALVHWYAHASAGKWFAVFESNEQPGIASTTRGHWAVLHPDHMSTFGRIASRVQIATPVLYNVEFRYDVIPLADLAAGGATT